MARHSTVSCTRRDQIAFGAVPSSPSPDSLGGTVGRQANSTLLGASPETLPSDQVRYGCCRPSWHRRGGDIPHRDARNRAPPRGLYPGASSSSALGQRLGRPAGPGHVRESVERAFGSRAGDPGQTVEAMHHNSAPPVEFGQHDTHGVLGAIKCGHRRPLDRGVNAESSN